MESLGPELSLKERIGTQPFDVIVIGAGINGAGIARDSAMRGLRVLLIDKSDIGSGTTPWSTRLIHGGLRYLEHYEVGLVRESLREREILLHIAPHLVAPLPFLIPIYERHKRGPKLVRLGMVAYDVLSWDKSVERHHMLSREETLRREPALDPRGLVGAALYYDAQVTFPERLSVENALSAAQHGATILTHVRAERLSIDGNAVVGVDLGDVLTGEVASARASVTVNVAGPWVDTVLGTASTRRLIGGTKGTHIVVDPFPGAPTEALYVEAETDRRPYFIVPWNDRYLIGTTDTRYTGDLDQVVPEEAEIAYLISETNKVIPSANLQREDVLYAYAGVRPLPYQDEGATGSITRRHIIQDHSPDWDGLISIVGGKLTTYRNLAEQTTDLVFKKLGRKSPACQTAEIPLPGGATPNFTRFTSRFKAQHDLAPVVTDHLLRVYGTRATSVLQLGAGDSGLVQPLTPDSRALTAEVVFAFEEEMARTIEDVMMRRIMTGLDENMGLTALEKALDVARRHRGWDDERVERERTEYVRYVEHFLPKRTRRPDTQAVTP